MATQKIGRLDKILQSFEDGFWFASILAGATGINTEKFPSPFVLRKALEKNEVPVDLVNFLATMIQGEQRVGQIWQFLLDHLTDLCAWRLESQRVFRVSESLANMLLETELPELLPSEVKIVVPAFVVVLDRPIECRANFQSQHDFFVFATERMEGESAAVSIRSYDPSYDGYTPYTSTEKHEIRKAFSGDVRSQQREVRRFQERTAGNAFTGFGYINEDSTPFNEILEVDDPELEARKVFFQICFGLNMYLQSARKSDSEVHRTVQVRPTDRGVSLAKKVQLFELSVSEAFQRPSRADGHTGHEVSPHFRRGFWRRPKGLGNDPDAPRTEWVRPTWVRRDKIAEGETPIGSFQGTDIQ